MFYHLFRQTQFKKVQLLVYDEDKDDARKTRKKSRRKRQDVAENASQMKVSVRADGQKTSKKKNSKLVWQRTVNLDSRIKDAKSAKVSSSYLTIEAGSLKLLAASGTPPKRPQRKLEPRRKFRGVDTVATTCIPAKAKAGRSCRRDAFCESTTSDDVSSDSGKPKVTKKKQKKKKQQLRKSANRGSERIKRASSAKTIRDNVWSLFWTHTICMGRNFEFITRVFSLQEDFFRFVTKYIIFASVPKPIGIRAINK